MSPDQHAWSDLSGSVSMFLIPALLGLHPAAVRLSTAFACTGVLLASGTDYPYPVHWGRRISFRQHGHLERLSLPVYFILPVSLGMLSRKRERFYFLTVLTGYAAAHLLTAWPTREAAPSPQDPH
ncbi:hypothetical protein ACFFLM_00805 [Deinococcus oregonensis]|uniref:Uncharacterized protein n=1 Tax=Deinococcus oregonensis TaxID=1805970 RepID=A0ABV6ASQ2_9DEIO